MQAGCFPAQHSVLARKRLPPRHENYDNQANQLVAKNLKGHLLLAHGTMDNNVPPVNTMLAVNELIKANKDFDLLPLPNRNHGFGNEPYMVRRCRTGLLACPGKIGPASRSVQARYDRPPGVSR